MRNRSPVCRIYECRHLIQSLPEQLRGICNSHIGNLSADELKRRITLKLCLICGKKLSIYNKYTICNCHATSPTSGPSEEALANSFREYSPTWSAGPNE